jgi:hypothetical protein
VVTGTAGLADSRVGRTTDGKQASVQASARVDCSSACCPSLQRGALGGCRKALRTMLAGRPIRVRSGSAYCEHDE